MKRRRAAVLCLVLALLLGCAPMAWAVPAEETPNYKVAFYPYDCYHMMDENGKRSGYGYEMMQGMAKYLQCTFSYVGYDKSAAECIDLLREGKLDIYTAARRTPEREAEFAFSTHPAITSYTCMNVKVGNTKIVPGDYSTYNGIRVGLLARHTYNGKFLEFVESKGFQCRILYYEDPTDLSNALVDGEVDALVNSYIRIPEDEVIIENFGQTPYYIMARKEDRALVEELDYAIDCMNLETPNWRTELYNKYYGSAGQNLKLTRQEQELLLRLQTAGEPIRALADPDNNPYSWYENGEAKGIAVDIFAAVAKELGLSYTFVPVSSRAEYEKALESGRADVWVSAHSCYEDQNSTRYKLTAPYLTTTVSVLRNRASMERITRLVTPESHITLRETAAAAWPRVSLAEAASVEECRRQVLSGEADGALLPTYTAQRLSKDDIQNRLRSEIVPGAAMALLMGINSEDSVHFYGLWEKTLARVSAKVSGEIVQEYLDMSAAQGIAGYLYDHPTVLGWIIALSVLFVFVTILYIQSLRSKRRQERISQKLAAALEEAKEATAAKQEFFSKMSHDIRTPLNVVLGMTQIAQKYRDDGPKLENALNNITQEGNYLLMMINSILDVNQLEHGSVELNPEAFNPAEVLRECAAILRPLSGKKEQTLSVFCDREDRVVRGDVNRLKQILVNIISNAIKYTGIGGHVHLTLECLPENRFRFTCADNGIGMTDEFIKHICEDYTRAEDSRVSKTQGTGLGMSVVKGFTDLMGGELTIESELGQGSSFCVELPFEEASQEERALVLKPAVEDGRNKPPYTGKKVLLVEDNALNAEVAMELLRTIGLRVDWAENGQVGVERYERSREDEYFAVFMDMQMPVMDGVAAAKRIRASTRRDHDVPIFAMTANTFASDRRSCREAGMNGYIPKPVSVKTIEDALQELGA